MQTLTFDLPASRSSVYDKLTPVQRRILDQAIIDRQPAGYTDLYRTFKLYDAGISFTAFYQYARSVRARADFLVFADFACVEAEAAMKTLPYALHHAATDSLMHDEDPIRIYRLLRSASLAIKNQIDLIALRNLQTPEPAGLSASCAVEKPPADSAAPAQPAGESPRAAAPPDVATPDTTRSVTFSGSCAASPDNPAAKPSPAPRKPAKTATLDVPPIERIAANNRTGPQMPVHERDPQEDIEQTAETERASTGDARTSAQHVPLDSPPAGTSSRDGALDTRTFSASCAFEPAKGLAVPSPDESGNLSPPSLKLKPPDPTLPGVESPVPRPKKCTSS